MTPSPKSSVKVMSALLTARAGKQEEFLQTLRSLVQEIRQQPGCLECAVGRDVDGDSQFFLFMAWKDLAHLENHMHSEAFRVLLGATSVLTAPSGFRFIAADSAFSPQGFLGRSRMAAPGATTPAP
jgi:quinol monooxygenase YgiN